MSFNHLYVHVPYWRYHEKVLINESKYSNYTVRCFDFMGQKEQYHKIGPQNGAMKN